MLSSFASNIWLHLKFVEQTMDVNNTLDIFEMATITRESSKILLKEIS
jgi:hypothetical protein